MAPIEPSTVAFIRRILSVAETGQEEWNPGAVYIYADDNRFKPARKQVTVAIGFTENGNLRKMLERYVNKGGQYASQFSQYLPGMGGKDRPSLAANQTFVNLLKQAGKDAKMKAAQEEAFDDLYLGPAFAWARKYGFDLALSYLVIADSYLHSGSMLGFLMAKFPDKKPSDGGDERAWINAYLKARHAWLKGHTNRILNGTIYRADCYMREMAKGNWDLMGSSVAMHGTTISRFA